MLNTTSSGKWSPLYVNLTDLSAFTRYEVTVDCIPLVDGQVAGFWSDQATTELTTNEDGLFVTNDLSETFI